MNITKSLSVAAAVAWAMVPAAGAQSPSPTPTPTASNRFLRVWNTSRRSASERIAARLQEVAQRRTTAYGKLLEQMYRILDRVIAAADRRAERGADVQAVRDAIATARRALDDARAAVRDVASKEYVFDEATDVNVADLLRAARHELEEDLRGVHEKLKAAHQALREAVRALNQAQIPPASDENT